MSEVPGHTMIVEPESQDDVVERLLGLSVVLGNLGLAASPRSQRETARPLDAVRCGPSRWPHDHLWQVNGLTASASSAARVTAWRRYRRRCGTGERSAGVVPGRLVRCR